MELQFDRILFHLSSFSSNGREWTDIKSDVVVFSKFGPPDSQSHSVLDFQIFTVINVLRSYSSVKLLEIIRENISFYNTSAIVDLWSLVNCLLNKHQSDENSTLWSSTFYHVIHSNEPTKNQIERRNSNDACKMFWSSTIMRLMSISNIIRIIFQ